MINHANEKETASQSQILNYLSDYGYKRLEEVTAEDLKHTLISSLEHLRLQNRKEKAQ